MHFSVYDQEFKKLKFYLFSGSLRVFLVLEISESCSKSYTVSALRNCFQNQNVDQTTFCYIPEQVYSCLKKYGPYFYDYEVFIKNLIIRRNILEVSGKKLFQSHENMFRVVTGIHLRKCNLFFSYFFVRTVPHTLTWVCSATWQVKNCNKFFMFSVDRTDYDWLYSERYWNIQSAISFYNLSEWIEKFWNTIWLNVKMSDFSQFSTKCVSRCAFKSTLLE